jgi:hypothetical protein
MHHKITHTMREPRAEKGWPHAKPSTGGVATLSLFATIWFAYIYVHQNPFEISMSLSRLDLLHALLSQHSFSVDVYHTNTPDIAFVNGHFYSDKAPGIATVALPGFAAAANFLDAVGWNLESRQGWLFTSWVAVATSVAVITACGGVCVFLWLRNFVRSSTALLSTFVFAFGSPAFAYATALMSHSVSASMIAISLCVLRIGLKDRSPSMERRDGTWQSYFLAGLSCGFAISCEYNVALLVAGLFIAVLLRGWRPFLWTSAGSVPALGLIILYNWICTGNVLTLPYSYESVFTEMKSGFFGIHLPNPAQMYSLLFGFRNGLFIWSPFLTLIALGFPYLFNRAKELFILCCSLPFLYLTVMSGYFLAGGGDTVGARFLLPAIPMLLLPAALGAQKAPRIAVILGVLSILLMTLATLTSLRLPHAESPVSFYFSHWEGGLIAPNIGKCLGLATLPSAMVLVAMAGAGAGATWHWLAPAAANGSDRSGDPRGISYT